MLQKIDHIGIAVKDINTALAFYQQGLNLNPHIEEVPAMKVRVAKLAVGESTLELIQPLAGEEAVTKFLANKGEGIHHICLKTDNVMALTKELIDKGYKPVYPEPKVGAGGHKVNFLSPRDTFGVLIEILE
ncbi:MAG: methylmalonyl-CoA epimerase [Candidatus Brocadiia bacterium]